MAEDGAAPMEVDGGGAAEGDDAAEEPKAADPADVAIIVEAGPKDAEEDAVVQECDVYLNRMFDPPDFVGDVYVLQYPLRPMYRPYGDQGILDSVDLKSKSRRLRFMYKLHQNDHFDEENVTNERLEQRHTLTSTVVANPYASYAVGVVHQGRMTLTPIRAMNQLRPDFEDYERVKKGNTMSSSSAAAAAAAASTEQGQNADGDNGGNSSDSGPDEEAGGSSSALATADPAASSAAVRVEYVPQARFNKAGNAVKEEAPAVDVDDPWKRLDAFDEKSAEAKDIYLQHIVWPAAAAAEAAREGEESDHPKLQALELKEDQAAFLASMCGAGMESERKPRQQAAPQDDDGLSSIVLSKMPPNRQIEAIVRHYSVASYAQVRKRLPPSILRSHHGTDANLVTMLQQCCYLVAGNWVLKSDVANFEGPEAYARDILLCILNRKGGELTKPDVDKWQQGFRTQTTDSARAEMLIGVCVRDRTGTYRLKNPPDKEFFKKFPEIEKQNDIEWEKRRSDIIQAAAANRGAAVQSGKARQSAAYRSRRSKLFTEVREALSIGASTLADLRRNIQKRNPTSEIREEDVLAILQMPEVEAVQVRDVWALGSTGMEANDKLRKVLLDLFQSRDSITKEELAEMYEVYHGERCKLSDYVVRQMMREIAHRVSGGLGGPDRFVLKSALENR
eukprot:TRINITY_DN7255_c1_g1_i1.p1 TRINITY_DN7255_c1_g1~~TRINITY_DN7255_c1_g1_i1.p1  ORF type:complete len:677 (-),score=153.80 TRINITY_DN7255_c1_g1_i1:100-2130(-)